MCVCVGEIKVDLRRERRKEGREDGGMERKGEWRGKLKREERRG